MSRATKRIVTQRGCKYRQRTKLDPLRLLGSSCTRRSQQQALTSRFSTAKSKSQLLLKRSNGLDAGEGVERSSDACNVSGTASVADSPGRRLRRLHVAEGRARESNVAATAIGGFVAAKNQKARVAAAGKELPAKLKRKKKTSRGK